jgi:hypothetical protein
VNPSLSFARPRWSRRGWIRAATGAAGALLLCPPSHAEVPEVALAGFAYTGDAASVASRFPYTVAYERARASAGQPLGPALREGVAKMPAAHVRVVPQIDELKGRDQALAVALVVSNETISVEQFGGLSKLFVLVRAQALFFDFKAMAVARAYPISFASIDVLDHRPSDAEVAVRVRGVYEGAAGKPGILARFVSTLAAANLPSATSRTLQITRSTLKPEVVAAMPESLRGTPAMAETWLADLVGEALSTRAGVPIIPYAKGYAVGNVMSMRVSDGDVYNLRLPKPDYEIAVELTQFRKVKFGSVPAGESFVYGSYASLQIEEPLTGKAYLRTALKNGETKVVPTSQTWVDDFPAYYDSVDGLFVKLAQGIDGRGDPKWIRAAAAAPDIDKQINETRQLFSLCK